MGRRKTEPAGVEVELERESECAKIEEGIKRKTRAKEPQSSFIFRYWISGDRAMNSIRSGGSSKTSLEPHSWHPHLRSVGFSREVAAVDAAMCCRLLRRKLRQRGVEYRDKTIYPPGVCSANSHLSAMSGLFLSHFVKENLGEFLVLKS